MAAIIVFAIMWGMPNAVLSDGSVDLRTKAAVQSAFSFATFLLPATIGLLYVCSALPMLWVSRVLYQGDI